MRKNVVIAREMALYYFKQVLEASYDKILIKYCILTMLFTHQTPQ